MTSPTVNASSISFSNVTPNSATVNWTNGNGGSRLLLVRPDSNINAFPLDGSDYTADSAFGSGTLLGTNNYVVYNGTGNSVTVRGLTPGAKYYFRVVEYNKNAVTGNNSLYLLGNNPEANRSLLSALPITLTYFKATKIAGRKAQLTWETEQEINNDYFEIQRAADGNDFVTIGKIPSKGNLISKTTYSFNDNTPAADKNYYRLKQTDKDAGFTYSSVASLNYSLSNFHHFNLVAGPGKGSFTVIHNGIGKHLRCDAFRLSFRSFCIFFKM